MEELLNAVRNSFEDRFSFLVGNPLMSDMIFLVGKEETRVFGHKLILSTCSSELNSHLLINNFLYVDASMEAFKEFLKYCYTGKKILNADNVMEILKLARRFEMKFLMRICLIKVGLSINEETCIDLFRQCDFLPKHSALKINIINAFSEYLLKISADEDQSAPKVFRDFSLSELEEIIDSIQDQMVIFNVLMEWAKGSCEKLNLTTSPENVRKSLGQVFDKIRFKECKIEQLFEISAKYPGLLSYEEFSSLTKKPQIALMKLIIMVDVAPQLTMTVQKTKKVRFSGTKTSSKWLRQMKTLLQSKLLGVGVFVRKNQSISWPSCYIQITNDLEDDQSSPSIHKCHVTNLERQKINQVFDRVVFSLVTPVVPSTDFWMRLLCLFHERENSLPTFEAVRKSGFTFATWWINEEE